MKTKLRLQIPVTVLLVAMILLLPALFAVFSAESASAQSPDAAALRVKTRTHTPTKTLTPTKTITPTLTPTITLTPTRTLTETPTPFVSSLPDLIVSSVVTEWEVLWIGGCEANLTMGVNVTVRNIGTAAAGAFVVDVSGTQQTVSGGLAAGASISMWFARTGSLVITADVTGLVAESDEGNNTLSYTTVPVTPPVLCTITPTAVIPTRTPTPTSVPGADFVGSPLFGEAPLEVQFTHLNTSLLSSCTWTFGDGTIETYAQGTNFSSCPSVSHTYDFAGSFTVSLRVVKATNGVSNTVTKTDYIEVIDPAGSTPTPLPPTTTPTP